MQVCVSLELKPSVIARDPRDPFRFQFKTPLLLADPTENWYCDISPNALYEYVSLSVPAPILAAVGPKGLGVTPETMVVVPRVAVFHQPSPSNPYVKVGYPGSPLKVFGTPFG